MNKTSKIILTIVSVLMAVALATYIYHISKPKPKAWSKEYISDLHDRLNKSFDAMSDGNQRNQVINCVIEKVKQVLPKGLESVSQDSAYDVIKKCTDDCTNGLKTVKGVIEWTEYNETHLRTEILRTLDTPVCDCYLSKLKSKYPEGVPISLPRNEKRAMVKVCDSEMKEIKQGQDRIIKLMKK